VPHLPCIRQAVGEGLPEEILALEMDDLPVLRVKRSHVILARAV
jgi:hypothetical protein